MIGWREGSIVWDGHRSYRPYGTDHVCLYQAFHAWLPSFRPSGTKVSPYVAARGAAGGLGSFQRFAPQASAGVCSGPAYSEPSVSAPSVIGELSLKSGYRP